MAVQAVARISNAKGLKYDKFEVRELVVKAALVLEDEVDVEATTTLRPFAEGTREYSPSWYEFRVCSWHPERNWLEHARGLVRVQQTKKPAVSNAEELAKAKTQKWVGEALERANVPITSARLYDALESWGAGYGPTFQGLESIVTGDDRCHAKLVIRDTKKVMPREYEPDVIARPGFFDGLIHMMWPLLGAGRFDSQLYMPTRVNSITISTSVPNQAGEYVNAYSAGFRARENENSSFDLLALHPATGEKLIEFEGLIMTPLRDDAPTGGDDMLQKLSFKFDWKSLDQITIEKAEAAKAAAEAEAAKKGEPVKETPKAELKKPIEGKPTREEPLEIVLLGDDQTPIADELPKTLSSTFTLPSSVPVTPLEKLTTAEGKTIIILETGELTLRTIDAKGFEKLRSLILSASKVLWVYRRANPDSQMTVGLVRTIRSETGSNVASLGIELGIGTHHNIEDSASKVVEVLDLLWPSVEGVPASEESEFKIVSNEILVPRVSQDDDTDQFVFKETHDNATAVQPYIQPGRRFKIEVGAAGQLDTLYFADDKEIQETPLANDEVEIEVKATGVNFKDVVVTMGQLAQPFIGIECSGIVSSVGKDVKGLRVGQRVMAMPEGAYSTYARSRATSAYPIPADLSFEEAASIPIVFCTAYYALFTLGQLQPGERALVHAGAGGVGQASIMLAQHIGADIFVTVGSVEKKEFLQKTYGIPDNRILSSRDASFAPSIKELTGGKGVDVVLNSLAGDLLRESWGVLAPFGRFIEIGKADITKNSRLDMSPYEYNVLFASVDLTKVAQFKPALMRSLLAGVSSLITDGHVRPIGPVTPFKISQLEQAFRTLQAGKNIGKVVVVPHADDQVKAVTTKTKSDLLPADGTYVLIGGTGGLGRNMAGWLSSKGARNIVLVSRSGSANEKIHETIAELAKEGTKVIVESCDVSSAASVEALVEHKLKDLPPIRGIVHGAMVLRVCSFLYMLFFDLMLMNITGCSVRENDI